MATQDPKVRRKIANDNERRRMESINAGFTKLRELICPEDKEKLSKASVLHQAVDYIYNLEDDKQRLTTKNKHLKRILHDHGLDPEIANSDDDVTASYRPPPAKHRKQDTESSSDESVGGLTLEDVVSIDNMRRELVELRCQLEVERHIRLGIEQRCRQLMNSELANETQKYSKNVVVVPADCKYVSNDSICSTSQRSATKKLHFSPKTESSRDVMIPCTSFDNGQTFALLSTSSPGNLESIVEAISRLEDRSGRDGLMITSENEIKEEDFAARSRKREAAFASETEIREESVTESKIDVDVGSCEAVFFDSSKLQYDEVSSPTRNTTEKQQLLAAAVALHSFSKSHQKGCDR